MDAPQSSTRPRPSSRPTTPLRPSSRSSLREAHGYGNGIGNSGYSQPAINALEPQFAELADSMADLEANFMHLQLMHESLTRFSESFASFLYGLNMNAFCVDFPEVRRTGFVNSHPEAESEPTRPIDDGEMTFMKLELMGSNATGLRTQHLWRTPQAPPPPPLDRRPSTLRAHEYRRVALPVVQQPAGTLHEALRAALVPAHFLGVEGLGLGKEPDA
ncbi:Pc22g01580 [Penicillium rubens Wisconsin 54-1255]|uniref:DASH complex subunit DAM1 n=1 Tax=Penicillium rubens (strain ATCC 28089 / DSM 1075 / NRRL 1951 / Wisconsin 54-1255) TaxID=500485 RepID=B6HPL0_PENRW|nr:Pc22g01580 [Penicillium rubens Wisconsin 54-1255]